MIKATRQGTKVRNNRVKFRRLKAAEAATDQGATPGSWLVGKVLPIGNRIRRIGLVIAVFCLAGKIGMAQQGQPGEIPDAPSKATQPQSSAQGTNPVTGSIALFNILD